MVTLFSFKLRKGLAAFGVAEKRSRLRKDGEDCLSEASSAAAGVGDHRRVPEGLPQGGNGFGSFCKTKGTRLQGRNPATYKSENLDSRFHGNDGRRYTQLQEHPDTISSDTV